MRALPSKEVRLRAFSWQAVDLDSLKFLLHHAGACDMWRSDVGQGLCDVLGHHGIQ